MSYQNNETPEKGKVPPQRKTTLKWGSDGELSAVDMARILDRLQNSKLTECEIFKDNQN